MQKLSFKLDPVAPHKANYIVLSRDCVDGVAEVAIDPTIVGAQYIVRIKNVQLAGSLLDLNTERDWTGYELHYPYIVTPCKVINNDVIANPNRTIRATSYNEKGYELDSTARDLWQWVTVFLSEAEAQEIITAQKSIKPVQVAPVPVPAPVEDCFDPREHERKKFRKLKVGMRVLVKRDFRKKYSDVMKGSLWSDGVDMCKGGVFEVVKLDDSDNTVFLSNSLWYSAADLKKVTDEV